MKTSKWKEINDHRSEIRRPIKIKDEKNKIRAGARDELQLKVENPIWASSGRREDVGCNR